MIINARYFNENTGAVVEKVDTANCGSVLRRPLGYVESDGKIYRCTRLAYSREMTLYANAYTPNMNMSEEIVLQSFKMDINTILVEHVSSEDDSAPTIEFMEYLTGAGGGTAKHAYDRLKIYKFNLSILPELFESVNIPYRRGIDDKFKSAIKNYIRRERPELSNCLSHNLIDVKSFDVNVAKEEAAATK